MFLPSRAGSRRRPGTGTRPTFPSRRLRTRITWDTRWQGRCQLFHPVSWVSVLGERKNLSRRELLRRTAITAGGGAVVWVAPAISSVSIAHASPGSPGPCTVFDCGQAVPVRLQLRRNRGAFVHTFSGACVCARPVTLAVDCSACPPGNSMCPRDESW